jgi:DNA-binding NarL/FixJ family response regulator
VGAGDGNAGVRRAFDLRPRAVVLDVRMPGPNGLRAATAIAQALPPTRIVILSGTDDVEAVSVPDDAVYVRKGDGMEDELRSALVRQG